MTKFECGEYLIAPFLCTTGALSPRFVSSWVFWLVSSPPKDEPSLDPSRLICRARDASKVVKRCTRAMASGVYLFSCRLQKEPNDCLRNLAVIVKIAFVTASIQLFCAITLLSITEDELFMWSSYD